MQFYGLCFIALSLSMDAFAVSICKGLSAGRPKWRQGLACGIWFGGFQALMPLIGWLAGVRFQSLVLSLDHWIAFFLLGLIGWNMIREALKGESEHLDHSFSPCALLPLAIATSIDAFAVGVTFAFLDVDILQAVSLIGVTTFVFSFAGVKLGATLGSRSQQRAELAGGFILIGMGVKILLEHTVFS